MDWTLFLTYFAACIAAGSTGAMFSPGAWYDSLDKPSWTPPNWLFPVAWTTLYILMSWSAARVAGLADGGAGQVGASGTTQGAAQGAEIMQGFGVGQALALWSLQIALNTLWTPVFFGLKRLGAGMVVLVFLWLAVAATMLAFFQVDWVAGLMFVPYLAWVTVAGALNFSIWTRNRHRPVPATA